MGNLINNLKEEVPFKVKSYFPIKDYEIIEIVDNYNEIDGLEFSFEFDFDQIQNLEEKTNKLYEKYNGRIPIREYTFDFEKDLNDLIFHLEDEYPQDNIDDNDKIEITCEKTSIGLDVKIDIKKINKKAVKIKRFIRT